MQLSFSPAHSHPLVLLLFGQLSHSHCPGAHLHSGSQLHAFLSPLEADAEAEEDSPLLLGQLAHVQVDPQAQAPFWAQSHDWVGAEAAEVAVVLDWQHLSISIVQVYEGRYWCGGVANSAGVMVLVGRYHSKLDKVSERPAIQLGTGDP